MGKFAKYVRATGRSKLQILYLFNINISIHCARKHETIRFITFYSNIWRFRSTGKNNQLKIYAELCANDSKVPLRLLFWEFAKDDFGYLCESRHART